MMAFYGLLVPGDIDNVLRWACRIPLRVAHSVTLRRSRPTSAVVIS